MKLLDRAIRLLEGAAGGTKIRGLVADDGAEIPLVRCSYCRSVADVTPAEGPQRYECYKCGTVVRVLSS